MKLSEQLLRHLSSIILAATLCSITVGTAVAKRGATDPIPGTSKGTTNSGGGTGGGGGKSSTTVVTLPPIPSTPVQPIVTATLTFSSGIALAAGAPSATGSYRVDPYYPTLSLLTVTVDCSAGVPNNTPLYLNVTGAGGTLYPFTSNVMNMVGGHGTCTYSVYVTPGTTLTGVVISDAAGIPYLSGK